MESANVYCLTSIYNRNLDISRTITTESSPLHTASSRTRTGNLWFPSASRNVFIEVWLTDQNNKSLEIEDNLNITLIIGPASL